MIQFFLAATNSFMFFLNVESQKVSDRSDGMSRGNNGCHGQMSQRLLLLGKHENYEIIEYI